MSKREFTQEEISNIIATANLIYQTSRTAISDICNLADSFDLEYAHCEPCEADHPVLDGCCLVCGTATVTLEKPFLLSGGWMDCTLTEIIMEYRGCDGDEPLDGDDVERLVEVLKAKIDFHEGNITENEYNAILG